MRLPREHQDKKKCTPQRKREGGGRIDTGSERRGGEVDKKRKKKTRGKFKGGGGNNKTRSRNLSKPQNQSWSRELVRKGKKLVLMAVNRECNKNRKST